VLKFIEWVIAVKKSMVYSLSGFVVSLVFFNSNVGSAQWIGPPVLVQQPLVDVVELNRFAQKNYNNNQSSSKNVRISSKISLTIQRRNINLASFVKKSRETDPAGAAEMAKLFASTDIIEVIGQAVAAAGLQVNNVADAYSIYWTSAWNASRGSTKTPSKRQMTSIKSLVANAILVTPAFVSANDSQKQEYAEALLIQAALIDSAVEKANGDPIQLRAIAKAVRKGAKASGFDLDNVTLTEEGFVSSSRETGLLEAGNDNHLASTPIKLVRSTDSNYVLIAAASGAGLGGMFLLGKAMGRKR
jgi:hypothetical protein